MKDFKEFFTTAEVLSINQITTISNGPDDGTLNNEVRCFWQPQRHGTTAQAINNILNGFNPIPSPSALNLVGHGNVGLLETGIGQNGDWDPEKFIVPWNRYAWEMHLRQLAGRNFPILTIWSCETGAEAEGAELLFQMAQYIQRPVRARTGLTIITTYSDGRCEISFENGSDWQVATPDHKPNPIPKPHALASLFVLTKKQNNMSEEKKKIPEINVEFLHPIQTPRLKTISPKEFSEEAIFSEPFSMPSSRIVGMITMNLRMETPEGMKTFKVYNDRIAHDQETGLYYYINPKLIDQLQEKSPDVFIKNTNVLYNLSVGGPSLKEVSITDFDIDRKDQSILAISKTFKNWMYNPWNIQSSNAQLLTIFSDINVSFVKAPDPNTGIDVVFATLLFRQTAAGWYNNHPGLTLRVFALNANDGLLEDWPVSTTHLVQCGENGTFITYKKTFRPDWFDLLQKVSIVINASTWFKCYGG